MHLTFRGVFLSLIQKHFPSTKRKREKGTGIKRKRKSSLTPSPAPASCPAAPPTATQLLCLLPFSPLHAFCCSPWFWFALLHISHCSLIQRTAALGYPPFSSLCPTALALPPFPSTHTGGRWHKAWLVSPATSTSPYSEHGRCPEGKKITSLPNYLLWLQVRRVWGFLLQWDVEAALAGCGAACVS